MAAGPAHLDPEGVVEVAVAAAAGDRIAIDPEVRAAGRRVALDGGLAGVPPALVWDGLAAALAGARPRRFVEALRAMDALALLLPELDRLFGIPQRADHHPEIDVGLHSLMVLDQATLHSPKPEVRLAALLHDLGKTLTPKETWPRHPGHEAAGVPLVEAMLERLEAPPAWRPGIAVATRWHGVVHQGAQLRPGTMVEVLEAAAAFDDPTRLDDLLVVCLADKRGRRGHEGAAYPAARTWREALAAASPVRAEPARLHQKRVKAIASARIAKK